MHAYQRKLWLLIRTSVGFVPLLMSLAAMSVVLGYVALFGVAHGSDEGAAAHIFQLLIVAQIPFCAAVAVKGLTRERVATVAVLTIQAAAMGAAILPVWALGL